MIYSSNLIEKTIAAVILLSAVCLSALCQEISWSRNVMDASRTGVVAASAENTEEALGRIEGAKYIAPNGKVFKKCKGVTYKVAKALIASQPKMKDVKTVIGFSAKPMERKYPESELTNWFVDELMAACASETGRKVDVGILNFGGVRINMPGGEIQLDDIMSMFPFKNNLCYVALKGKYIREIVENMARTNFQILGGIRCESRGNKLTSMTIGGEPVDDEKIYGVSTISFLLDGGDNISVAKDATEVITVDKYVMDIMVPVILNRNGKPLEYEMDGRIKCYTEEGEEIPVKKL